MKKYRSFHGGRSAVINTAFAAQLAAKAPGSADSLDSFRNGPYPAGYVREEPPRHRSGGRMSVTLGKGLLD